MADATTATTEVPAKHEGAGFPPFKTETFPSQLFWLAITFVALYLLMSRIALPRIGTILEGRQQRISGDLGEAQRLKGEGDAKASAIYNRAFSADPEFYSFYRSLDAYRATLHSKGDVLLLDPSSDFFKYFKKGPGR